MRQTERTAPGTKHNKKKKDIVRCPFLCFCPHPHRLTHCTCTPHRRPRTGLRPGSRLVPPAWISSTKQPTALPQSAPPHQPAFHTTTARLTAAPSHSLRRRTEDFIKILHSLVGEIYIRRIYLCCKCEIIYFCMKPKAGTINKIAAKW